MRDPMIAELARRLERLERSNRRWRGLGVLAVIALVIAGGLDSVGAGNHSRIVEAERFVLLSADGAVRAELATQDADGQVGLRLMGGKSEVVLALTPPGTPRLEFRDETGTLRVALGDVSLIRPGGTLERRPPSSLVLFSGQGRVVWETPSPVRSGDGVAH
jgi:hypothetical protein